MSALPTLGLKIPNLEFLKGYWGVPMSSLLSYDVLGDIRTPKIDITLWEITHTDGSYFFGKAYANVGGGWSTRNISGMVAPNNRVYITFENSSFSNIIGIGELYPNYQNKFLKKKGLFIMQMSTTPSESDPLYGIHSSYMFPITQQDIFYNKLPGSNTLNGGNGFWSVPQFIQLAIDNT
jgi:hypothetical protein